MAKAKRLLAEANPSVKDITVWTDDEPVHQRIGEYYQDLLTRLGFNVQLQVLAGGVYSLRGNEQYATFVSDRMDFDSAYYHLLFGPDFSALRSSSPGRSTSGICTDSTTGDCRKIEESSSPLLNTTGSRAATLLLRQQYASPHCWDR